MTPITQFLNLVTSGAVAYFTASSIRDSRTRPNILAGFQLAESGSVPFLEALRDRAIAEGDEWLAERLGRHAQDERRHGQIFANGLKQMNKQVIDMQSLKQQAEERSQNQPQSSDDRQRSPFFAAYFEGYTQEDLKPQNIDWTVFLASTYILELDASKDFVLMANALPDDESSAALRKGILSVAKDEERHAAYLREAMGRSLSYGQVCTLIDEWRTRKVKAMVAMVGNLLNRGGKLPSMVRDGVPPELSEGIEREAVAP